ncbi:MAG: hypothetical protein HY905_02375 [Deltaproteobacteria bacterium]|nr:hypothetical protein [Deltaproteobacteria bacterium]
MRLPIGIMYVFLMGWTMPIAAAAGESARLPTVVLRICDRLDAESILGILNAHFQDLNVRQGDEGGATSPWLAELCADSDRVVSTLTNTTTGASDTQTWPVPLDVGDEGLDRFAAHILGNQIRTGLEASPHVAPPTPGGEEDEGAGPPSAEASALGIDLYFAVGFESVGGLTDRTDAASIALGPGLFAGVILGQHGIVGVGIRSLTVLGSGPGMDLLETLPLSIGGGWNAPLGPVEVQAVLEVIAERWWPSGSVWGGGWRGGLGARGGLVVPLGWMLRIRVDFGVEYFTEGYSLGYTTETSREFVAELSNLRWRASAGLELRFPVQ